MIYSGADHKGLRTFCCATSAADFNYCGSVANFKSQAVIGFAVNQIVYQCLQTKSKMLHQKM